MAWLPRVDLGLPSEAQWEHGARAGTTSPWWTGAERESLRGRVNLADQAAKRTGARWPTIADWPDLEDGSAVHSVVGKYAANPFGLHEVHGNISEWCLDAYDGRFYAKSAGKDPVCDPEAATTRVTRGGSFSGDAYFARSAYRLDTTPSGSFPNLGVRPVKLITE